MIAARLLSCSGERCVTTTKAILGLGVLTGKWAKNCSRAYTPPAEAPMPTTRNLLLERLRALGELVLALARGCVPSLSGLLVDSDLSIVFKSFLVVLKHCFAATKAHLNSWFVHQ